MNFRHYLPVFVLALGMTFWGWGCDNESNSADDPATQMSDQEALEQLFLEDLEMEGADVWGDEDPDGGGGTLDELIEPLHWARLGHRGNVIINVVIEGDSIATITRVLSFDGVFRVVTERTDSSVTYIDKPMYNELVRKARAIRVNRTRFPRLNWRLVEVTPEVLTSDAPNPHTIYPVNVELYRNGTEGLELITEISDPLDTWFDRENLPTLYPEEEVILFVTANREGGFGVLHPHMYRHGPRHARLPMNDDGEYPDEVAGDGIYSGSYMTGPHPGIFHAGLDLIDGMTLFDSEGPYDSGGWGVPYRVMRPEM